jgi:hypothetical protein
MQACLSLCSVLLLCSIGAPAIGQAQSAPTTRDSARVRRSFAPDYVASLDPVVRAVGLKPLRHTYLSADTREVRLWIGGGLFWPQDLYRVVSENGRVTGEWYRYWDSPAPDRTSVIRIPFGILVRAGLAGQCGSIRTRGDTEVCEVRFSHEPDWSAVLDRMSEAEVWTLPDQTALPDDRIMVADGWMLTVEIRQGRQYRTYNYSNPGSHQQPEAKQARRIADALRSLQLLVPRALTPGQVCGPVDSVRVREWHAEWDTANIARRAYGGSATSGELRIPPTSRRHVPGDLATGTFLLRVGDLRRAQADTFELYALELHHAGLGDSLHGRLINLAEPVSSGDAVSGVLGRHGGMAFGRSDAFLTEDGESYDIVEIGPEGFRGWYTGGAVVPEPLAYFCAERIR